jgi:hypothetical protein
LYVLGILTMNVYLYRLGLTELTLVKVRYIYTGAITLLPVFMSFLVPIAVTQLFEMDRHFVADYFLSVIPEQFGGAKPRLTQIVLNKDAAERFTDVQIEIPSKLELVFETDSELVLREIGGLKPFRIDKDEVVAIFIVTNQEE